MNKQRLDQELVNRDLVTTRSQAESYIKLGMVRVEGMVVSKPGFLINLESDIQLITPERYVSRAGLKLASVAELLELTFSDKVVLDVGSSTGGFTDYALRHGARRVIAVDVGTNQLHELLRQDPRVELHEKTDIRDFHSQQAVDIVVADLSFISLREILPSLAELISWQTQLVVMVKPQFEAPASLKHKGVIKNDRMRRDILKDFEHWVGQHGFVIINKADSQVAGAKGNRERFYLLLKPMA